MHSTHRMSLRVALVALFAVFAFDARAGQTSGGEGGFNAGDLIMHHILDEHGWHLVTYEDSEGHEHHVSIPLPVILFVEGETHFFMSSDFDHETMLHKSGDKVFKLGHGKIYYYESEEQAISDGPQGHENGTWAIYDFSVTKNVVTMAVAVLLLLYFFLNTASAYKKRPGQAPKGMQNFFETLVLFVRDDIAIPNLGEKYKRFFPFLCSLFFFIWMVNLLGLIPTGANASGNILFTFTLAWVFTFMAVSLSGNKDYWMHIFWTPGIPFLLRFIMLPVEIIGMFTKPFALMIRLFANITAGHIVVLSLVSFMFIFGDVFSAAVGLSTFPVVMLFTIPVMLLELFVAALQAYVFTVLTALFLGMAVEEHHHDEHHDHEVAHA